MGIGSYGAGGRVSKAIAAFGFAIWGMAATAGQVTLIAFGDSLTQGYGLIEQEGFVPRLREWLDDQGRDVRVINAGVSGDTTAGGLARMEWSLTPEIDGMILALGGNDLLRGLDPAAARANLDGMMRIATDKGLDVLLVGMQAPGNYGPDYKAAFDAIYPELAEEYGALYKQSFFEGILAEGDSPADAQRYMQPDGIHPNAEGVAAIVEAFGPQVLELIDRIEAGAGG